MPILTNLLGLKDASILTIATGVITITQTMHTVAAESSTTDDLDTINISANVPTTVGSDTFRSYILLRADTGDTITVKHGTGNITLASATDYVLSGSKTLQLLYTGSAWVDLQSSAAISIGYATDDVTNPPTDAELDTAFGTPATVGAAFIGILNDAGGGTNLYMVASDGTNWWYSAMTKAV